MAMHTELQIHKAAEELLGIVLNLVRNIPRDLKQVVGAKLRDERLQVMVLIGRANMARDKLPHLNQLLESIWMINYLMRALTNQGVIAKGQHAKTMQATASIGRQANAWKKSITATAPSSPACCCAAVTPSTQPLPRPTASEVHHDRLHKSPRSCCRTARRPPPDQSGANGSRGAHPAARAARHQALRMRQ